MVVSKGTAVESSRHDIIYAYRRHDMDADRLKKLAALLDAMDEDEASEVGASNTPEERVCDRDDCGGSRKMGQHYKDASNCIKNASNVGSVSSAPSTGVETVATGVVEFDKTTKLKDKSLSNHVYEQTFDKDAPINLGKAYMDASIYGKGKYLHYQFVVSDDKKSPF